MADVRFKAGVVVLRYTPALDWMLRCLLTLARREPWNTHGVTVTSIQDGVHPAGPAHEHGRALDVRTKHLPTSALKHRFLVELERELDAHPDEPGRFRVILEHEGEPQEHLHAQVKRGQTFLGA